MATASKAELIGLANGMRRYARRQRQINRAAFSESFFRLRAQLGHAGVGPAEIDDLLPLTLNADDPPFRLRPLADHVVIRPATPKERTEGGIIIPDNAQEVPMRGTVLAVGPGRTEPGVGTITPAVTVGDDVLFGRYAGVEVALDGEAVRIMREEDCLGVLAPETSS